MDSSDHSVHGLNQFGQYPKDGEQTHHLRFRWKYLLDAFKAIIDKINILI